MGVPDITRQQTGLTFTNITDKGRHDLVVGIKQAAATSTLVLGNAGMQTSLALILSKDTALTAAIASVATDRAKLNTDLTTEAQCRNDLDGEIRSYATLASGNAKTQADITGAGLPGRGPIVKSKLPPGVPEQIDTSFPQKGHGRATVSVHQTGPVHGQYVAESSPDPITPTSWSVLGMGYGKTRAVTGPSGTKVWVRFARVRGQQQSDWSVPVLVTIP